MHAEIVEVPQYEEGKYEWTETAVIVKPSSITEETFLKSILKDQLRPSVRIFDQDSYEKWMKTYSMNRAQFLIDEEERKKKIEESQLAEEEGEKF